MLVLNSVVDLYCFQYGSGSRPDPDPAFYLNADPDPGQTLKSQKLNTHLRSYKQKPF
jgi:hypothetical protein